MIIAMLLINNNLILIFYVVGVVEDDFLSVELTSRSKSEQFHEEVSVSFDVEDHTVAVCFMREEYARAK